MNKKDVIGISLGIIFLLVAVAGLWMSSKADQKGRTTPAARYSWEKVTFQDPELNKILKDLQVGYTHGFLFRKDSLTPIYFPVYIGKSAKGAEAVKAYFPNAKQSLSGYMIREESALKLLGIEKPAIFSGKKIRNDIEISFSGDDIIISFTTQSTNVVLDPPQMIHFLHRYFKKNEKKPEPAVSAEQPAAKPDKKK